jgi:2-polyprenyl-3-methyl-5-hydroxy-6-metoxy-1,4-benzoquinol methylase
MTLNNDKKNCSSRRVGDLVKISGRYQWDAANSKNKIQRFWHQTKKTSIDSLCPPIASDFVLDVGCGSGVISSYLAKKYNAKVVGIDGNQDAIDFAKKNFPEVSFQCSLVDDDFSLMTEVDSIYCLELIEHIHENQANILLNNFFRLLKPGGRLFLTTPNYKSAWPLIERAMDFMGVAPRLSEDQHVTFYNPETLRKIVINNGFDVKHIRTNCFIAPWVAPFSYKVAEWIDRKELNMKKFFGSIIVLVALKP